MENKGILYLIPNVIADSSLDKITTPQLLTVLPKIHDFLVENVRTARRFLSSLKVYPSIESLNFSVVDQNTTAEQLPLLMAPLHGGLNMGVISEAGCPGVADPGAVAVLYAHQNNIHVIPLVGPSSILLALMSSGLNGQKFAFHGYLPVDKNQLINAIREFEKESKSKHQTQIFIETPYRNQSVLDAVIKTLHPDTLLTIAIDVTGPNETILTKSVRHWREQPLGMTKTPAVFLFLA